MGRYNGTIGRTAQSAKEGGTQGQGRWPKKSCKLLLGLMLNAELNAWSHGLNLEKLYLKHILVNRAIRKRRRTYRAHGRTNPYMNNSCHIKIIIEERQENVDSSFISYSRKRNRLLIISRYEVIP